MSPHRKCTISMRIFKKSVNVECLPYTCLWMSCYYRNNNVRKKCMHIMTSCIRTVKLILTALEHATKTNYDYPRRCCRKVFIQPDTLLKKFGSASLMTLYCNWMHHALSELEVEIYQSSTRKVCWVTFLPDTLTPRHCPIRAFSLLLFRLLSAASLHLIYPLV